MIAIKCNWCGQDNEILLIECKYCGNDLISNIRYVSKEKQYYYKRGKNGI